MQQQKIKNIFLYFWKIFRLIKKVIGWLKQAEQIKYIFYVAKIFRLIKNYLIEFFFISGNIFPT